MLRETGSQLTQQAILGQKERYPVLGNTLRQVPDEEQLPVSRYSAMDKLHRKKISSPNLGKLSSADKDTAVENTYVDDPFKDGIYDSGPVVPAKSPRIASASPSKISAGAAAVEKSVQESRLPIEPRQTRTSSLRARLSAGQLIKDSQDKVVGFTDFTANPEPVLASTRRNSLRARKEAQTRRSLTPPANHVPPVLRKNSSNESVGGNPAPAQFIAGSRRPTHPRRPSSRGSLRSEYRESTPPLPSASSSRTVPTRPPPAIPKNEDTRHGKSPEKAPLQVSTSKSSIPVPRQTIPKLRRQPSDKAEGADPKKMEVNEVKEVRISERHSPIDIVRDLDQKFPDTSFDTMSDLDQTYPTVHPSQALVNSYGAHILEAIEESPQRTYKLKRLSTASPEFGPTLKISPSAERLIMGPDSGTGTDPLKRKERKEQERLMAKETQKNHKDSTNSAISASKKHLDRPSSSQGLSRRGPRNDPIDTKDKEKKVKSADLSTISPAIEHLLNGSHQLTPRLIHENTGRSARGSSTSTSLNDPFFDARSQLQASPDKGNDFTGHEPDVNGEDAWIPPLKQEISVSKDKMPISTGSPFMDPHIQNGNQPGHKFSEAASDPFKGSTVTAQDIGEETNDGLLPIDSRIDDNIRTRSKLPDESNPFEDTGIAVEDFGKDIEEKKNDTSTIYIPSTPEQRPPKSLTGPDSHPPRSSSRMAHPDFTTAKTSAASPLSADNQPPTPSGDTPQDFAHRQNNLGSLRGHGTSQIDLSNHASKRESTARESSKSGASASKGSLSIFRGLFHKRSSEKEPLKSGKKPKTKATTKASSGSPFPPISDVHPIHRPTLASIARSAAGTPRPSTAPRPGTPATPATPTLFSPLPTETSTSTTLAMELLDLSLKERSSPKKESLLQLGSVMVEGITQARNAEKAMEEAKQAARRSEVAYALCKKSLAEATRCVEAWRRGLE